MLPAEGLKPNRPQTDVIVFHLAGADARGGCVGALILSLMMFLLRFRRLNERIRFYSKCSINQTAATRLSLERSLLLGLLGNKQINNFNFSLGRL